MKSLTLILLFCLNFSFSQNDTLEVYRKRLDVKMKVDTEPKIHENFNTKYIYSRFLNIDDTYSNIYHIYTNNDNSAILADYNDEYGGIFNIFSNDYCSISLRKIENSKTFNYFEKDNNNCEWIKGKKSIKLLKSYVKDFTVNKSENEKEVIYSYDIQYKYPQGLKTYKIELVFDKSDQVFNNNILYVFSNFFSLYDINFSKGRLLKYTETNPDGNIKKLFELKSMENVNYELKIYRGSYLGYSR